LVSLSAQRSQGRARAAPAFSLDSCPAFDISIGRVNYLTELEP